MSLRQGFKSSSAKRRRTVSRDRLSCSVSLTIASASSSNVQRLRPRGGFEQAVATSSAISLPDSLRAAPGARLLAQREFQIAFDEAPLGSINRRSADPHGAGNRLVAGPRVGGEQDLRPFEFARRVSAAAQQRFELETLRLAQIDPIPYLHRLPSRTEDS